VLPSCWFPTIPTRLHHARYTTLWPRRPLALGVAGLYSTFLFVYKIIQCFPLSPYYYYYYYDYDYYCYYYYNVKVSRRESNYILNGLTIHYSAATTTTTLTPPSRSPPHSLTKCVRVSLSRPTPRRRLITRSDKLHTILYLYRTVVYDRRNAQ